jgi:Acetyltransferase (GNAT) domain
MIVKIAREAVPFRYDPDAERDMSKRTGSIKDTFLKKAKDTALEKSEPRRRTISASIAPRADKSRPRTKSILPQLKLRIEMRHLRDMGDIRGHWTALVERALEANAFYEPAFTEAACLHLPHERNVSFVLIWSSSKNSVDDSLLGLFPVVWPRWPLIPSEVKGWSLALGLQGAPLVDTIHAEAVLTAYLDWLSQRGQRCATVMFPTLDIDGAFAKVLRRVLERTGRDMSLFGRHERVVMSRVSLSEDVTLEAALAASSAKLKAKGRIKITATETSHDVRNATEAFMALESDASPKRSNTLLGDSTTATFTRAMLRKFAQSGRCRIHLIHVGNQLAAGMVTIQAGNRVWLWRSATSKAFAGFAVKALLMNHIVQNLSADQHLVPNDLAQIAPINQSGTQIHVADCLVTTGRTASSAAMSVIIRETANRSLRGLAHSALRVIQGGRT